MKLKKILSIFLSVGILFNNVNVSLFANTNNDVEPYYLGTTTTHYYDYSVTKEYTTNEGAKELFYVGAPASRDGEKDVASANVSVKHTYSGDFKIEIKKYIEATFGVTIDKTKSFSISKVSNALSKGEYVKAYWQKSYLVRNMRIVDNAHITGWEQETPGGAYVPVDRWEVAGTGTGVFKEAIMPQITLEYYSSKSRGIVPIKIEVYEFINGEYVLSKVE